MVAIVHNSGSLRNGLHYNENKVKQQIAECIHSMNYPKDTAWLSFKDKITRLEKLTALNQQTKINSVHISLNFDPSETLSRDQLKAIAEVYMQKIGFGEQPYLVYQHYDAGHPHLHIVTTNIRENGKRIELHNLGQNRSMKASKEIEKEFNLVRALSKSRLGYELKPVNVQKVQYGKGETKRAITNVLDAVLPYYKYTSLAELNAVLKLYNVIADRGSEQSRTYKHGGLVYRMLNEKGEMIGVPIKASLIYNKPTLKWLESKFSQNNTARQRHKQRVKNAIDLSFARKPSQSLNSLQQSLIKERIQLWIRQNDKSIIYGLTYIDHHTKCVFNGSDLGKQYSANAILQRCNGEVVQVEQLKQPLQAHQQVRDAFNTTTISTKPSNNVLQVLTQDATQPVIYELQQDQKRKRKKPKLN